MELLLLEKPSLFIFIKNNKEITDTDIQFGWDSVTKRVARLFFWGIQLQINADATRNKTFTLKYLIAHFF
jgi:hypothetical protein